MRHEQRPLKGLLRHSDLLAALAVVVVVTMLVVPLPPMLIDLLITLNISVALTIVIARMYFNRALDLPRSRACCSSTTMFRLAINVWVTRLILTPATPGAS